MANPPPGSSTMDRETGRKPELHELEAMVAEAEAKAIELRPTAPDPDKYPALRASRERASAMLIEALGLTDVASVELDRLGREHDAELHRLVDDAKQIAIEGSGEWSHRLEALATSEHSALRALSDDWRNPWVPSWPPVYFIRSTPGGLLGDTHIEEAKSWAEWRCATSLHSGTERLSFFHLWQNREDQLVLADISVRLNLTGHFECSAQGWGLPAGWWSETRSEADLSTRLTVWPLWLAHDPLQQPQYSLPVASLDVTAGVFSQSKQTSINESLLVRTARFAVPPEAYILIEASVAVEISGDVDLDFSSGDFRVGCPYCFVTVPATQLNVNL